jgi:hypothetical protein
MQKLWDFVVENRETLTWLGGGVVAVAGGIWAIIKHFFPSEPRKQLPAGPTVSLSGAGIASGGDTHVQIGLDEEEIRRIVQLAIKPLNDGIEQILARIAHEKGIPAPPLRSLYRLEQATARVPEQNVPQFLSQKADDLGRFRTDLSRLGQTSSSLAPLANRAQVSIDRGDLVSTRDAISTYKNYLGPTANNKPATPAEKAKQDQEVQLLIKQWKTITDMTSNLSKYINDMAMTAVRNLR